VGSKKQTILTLNGRRYDALTGKAIDSDNSSKSARLISDVVGTRAENSAPVVSQAKATPKAQVTTPGTKVMDVSRSSAYNHRRQAQRASTLMRNSVSKPKPSLKSQTKVLTPTSTVIPSRNSFQPKWAISQVDPTRQNRAEQVAKSTAISKFSAGTDFVPTPAPQAQDVVRPQSTIDTAVQQIENQSQQSKDLFERAIAAADSHTEPPVDQKKMAKQAKKQAKLASKPKREHPTRHHLVSVVAASVAVLAIGGIIGLQNRAAITLRFANAKAGFQASLPGYQPDGYSVGNFTYTAGSVGTSFTDDASNRQYTLVQQTTKWDSQALLNNYVHINYSSYQMLQSGQQIIYVYGHNDASWVKDGVWYQLTSNGSLSTSQVLSIASSI
jgi:hypothetical protein